MAKVYEKLTDRLRDFITSQPVYFVATAPETGGHVNVSPKGYADTFAVIDDTTVAYLDLIGSGVETISHIRDNGRVTLMFCAFSGPPNIVRLYGTGTAVTPEDPEFADLIKRFGPHRSVRSIIVLSCDRISDSCGFAVPLMTYDTDRPLLDEWASRRDDAELTAYKAKKNRVSIDGLPGLPAADDQPIAESTS